MSEPRIFKAHQLIADFALGIDGELQGLTPAELQRAWRARHGDALERCIYVRLSEQLLVQLLPRRACEVMGQRARPYAPAVMERAPW